MRAHPLLPLALACIAACATEQAHPDAPAALDAVTTDVAFVPDAMPLDATWRDALDAMVAPDAGPPTCPVTRDRVLTFELAHGAFPGSGHPDVAVHIPPGYDACARQGAVLYIHGHNNCVTNAIGDAPSACTPGGPARAAHHLITQLDDAHVNALLIAIEVRFDVASGDPGALANTNGLRDLLNELFDAHLSPLLGQPTRLDDLERVVLASHSGGYIAVARALERGGLTNLREVQLYDSLYGEVAAYQHFTIDQITRFDPMSDAALRFNIVFTDGGGTATLSRNLGAQLSTGVVSVMHPEWLLFDTTTATLTSDAFAHPLIVKRSMLSHDDVVRYYFGRMVAASGFAPIR